ncbi:MAG: hypothetical protein SFV15_21355 [Polyangiaceae bacterium]|nr:hypothetical protein [Polyangiaceae bacterium]
MDQNLEDPFVRTMPAAYVKKVAPALQLLHSRIAALRDGALVSVGAFPSDKPESIGLCVVAEDRPGLLATFSAGLFSQGFNVIDAEAYTRARPDGIKEAVDLFWVRRVSANAQHLPILPGEILALKAKLVELLEGRAAPIAPPKPAGVGGETRVRFLESDDGSFSTLEVQSTDRPGLLLALTQALFDKQVQIVGCQVKTIGDKVSDRFELSEQNGHPIRPERQLEIQVAILSVIGDSLLN